MNISLENSTFPPIINSTDGRRLIVTAIDPTKSPENPPINISSLPSALSFHFGKNQSIQMPAKMNITGGEDEEYEDGFGPEYIHYGHKNGGEMKESTWNGVLMGASFSNILILFFLLAISRGKRGYFGIRLYILNLAIFSLIQIIVLIWNSPDDLYGLRNFFAFCLQDFMDKYNGSLLEATQIVYLSSTTVLMLDCFQKYRNFGIGIGKKSWALAILCLDILPLIYIFVKGIRFEYIQIRPKPLAIYHIFVLIIFSVVSTFLGFILCCLPLYRCCHRKQEEIAINDDQNRRHALKEKIRSNGLMSNQNGGPLPKPFTISKLFCLFAFILLTSWPQFTVFNLGVDLQSNGGIGEAKEMAHEMQKPNGAIAGFVHFMQKTRLVYWLMSIQKWAALFRPFLESLFAILLLLIPSMGSKFQFCKICPIKNENENIGNNFLQDRMIPINQIPSAPSQSQNSTVH